MDTANIYIGQVDRIKRIDYGWPLCFIRRKPQWCKKLLLGKYVVRGFSFCIA